MYDHKNCVQNNDFVLYLHNYTLFQFIYGHMHLISKLREKYNKKSNFIVKPIQRPDLFSFLGSGVEERSQNLAKRVIEGEGKEVVDARKNRKTIFEYIVKFWERSLLEVPFGADVGYGVNLAKRPFLTPSGPAKDEEFTFGEQYRWDTFFQNRGLIIAGGYNLAVDQLLNLADVFEIYHRIPNALTSVFLSHAQPPLEIIAVEELIQTVPMGEWYHKVMRIIEQDLLTEWLDTDLSKLHLRQSKEMTEKYGWLTRQTRMHFHSLLAGCEDGKDHNWITARFGHNYLPVQLNSIIFMIINGLHKYYANSVAGNDLERSKLYEKLKEEWTHDFQMCFWQPDGKWQGFCNYSIEPGNEGRILYGDLSAQIWPLYAGIATAEQAKVVANNLENYYAGKFGLATTSKTLREGSWLSQPPEGSWAFQWEYPNVWPPLMFVAVEGLKKYNFVEQAYGYEKRWVEHAENEFKRLNGFAEKYIFSSDEQVEEGYYGNIEGFGWTIGVYLHFLQDLNKNGLLK